MPTRTLVIDDGAAAGTSRGDVFHRRLRACEGDPSTAPLLWHDEHDVRAALCRQARTWALEVVRRTLPAGDPEADEEARLLASCSRDVVTLLESLHLLRAYTTMAVRSLRIARLLVRPDLATEQVHTLKGLAAELGIPFGYSSRGRVRAEPYAIARRWQAWVRQLPHFGWLLLRLRRAGAPHQLRRADVLVESGSIQSVRNVRPIVADLRARGLGCAYVGLRKYPPSVPERHYYNPGWIGRTMRMEGESAEAEVIDLLEHVPRGPVRSSAFSYAWRRFVAGSGIDWSQGATTAPERDWLRRLSPALNRRFAYDWTVASLARSAARAVAEQVRPSSLLVSDITNSTGRQAGVFRAHGTRVIVIQDGIISNENCRHLFADDFDTVTVWGERFRSLAAREFGWKAEQILVTGAHRVASTPLTPHYAEKDRLCVLLIGQPVSYDEDDFGAWWTWVVSSVPDSWPLRLRPHPRQDLDQLRHRLRATPTVTVSTGTSLESDFAWADVVVAEYSTTVLEAIDHGVPAIVVDAGSRTDPGFLQQLLPSAIVHDKQDLRRRFERLSACPAERIHLLTELRRALPAIVERTGPEALAATVRAVLTDSALARNELARR